MTGACHAVLLWLLAGCGPAEVPSDKGADAASEDTELPGTEPPTVEVTPSPASPAFDDDLRCAVDTSLGATVASVRWYRNGLDAGDGTAVVGHLAQGGGDTWRCVAIVEGAGGRATASASVRPLAYST